MNKLPINDMLLFVDVIKLQSFTKAAKKHGMTSAALSKRISSLENHLNILLLTRTTRKLAPTESGEVLYQYCSSIYADAEQAYNAALDLNENPRGLLTISSPTNLSNLVLSPLIAEFSCLYPEIKVKVTLNDVRDLPDVGDFCIAFRSGQLKDSSFIARKLMTVHFIYCASPTYFANNPAPKTPHEISQHRVVDYNYREEGGTWTFFENKLQTSIEVHPSIIANNALFVKCIAINGGGIACLPNFMVEEELASGELIPCLNNYQSLSQPVWLIHPYTHRYLPRKERLFVDFVFSKLAP